jgi:predicted RNA binding protein YcfA (HicA-like mRNA interferase family)
MMAKDVMDTLRTNGWTLIRVQGSHHVFEKTGAKRTIPVHGNGDLGVFAKRILKQAGIKT